MDTKHCNAAAIYHNHMTFTRIFVNASMLFLEIPSPIKKVFCFNKRQTSEKQKPKNPWFRVFLHVTYAHCFLFKIKYILCLAFIRVNLRFILLDIGSQLGGSGHEFFDQQNQQQNWYQQQQPGDMPANSQANNPNPPATAAPMFYNPADYAKGAVTQPAIFNPAQQQQDDSNQQQQQQQQSEMNQQLHADNYPNSVNQWQDNTNQQQGWNYPHQDPNYNYSEGNMHEHPPSHDYMPNSYGQQPYYSQQSNDSMQGNGDHHPLQWNQPPVSQDPGSEWNNQNFVNPVQNDLPQGDGINSQDQETEQANSLPVEDDDDSGGGYIGMFNKDDDESDFLESDKTNSLEHTNQQELSPPRTQGDSENVASLDSPPSVVPQDQSQAVQHQPVLEGSWPSNQVEMPPVGYSPSNQLDLSPPRTEGYPVNTGDQAYGSVVQQVVPDLNRQQSNISDTVPTVQQPFQQNISSEGQSFQNQYSPQGMNPQDRLVTRLEGELHSNDGGSDIGAPSEHWSTSSVAGSSIHPSDSSASLMHHSDSSASLTTSRSNSLLEDGSGSTAPSTGISSSGSQENVPIGRKQGESGNISAPFDTNTPYMGEGHSEQSSVEATLPPFQAPDNKSIFGQQNVQVTNAPGAPYLQGDVPPTDISRQNSALSDTSSTSVPSDTNVSRTGSLLAESEQQLPQNIPGPPQMGASEPGVTGASVAPPPGASVAPPPLSTHTSPQNQENSVSKQDVPPVTQPSVQTLLDNIPQPSQSFEIKPGEKPPPESQINPQVSPVSQSSNATVTTPPVQPQASQASNPLMQTNPLLAGTAHPSAFRTVRAQHNKTPTSAAVNPSPPLWSTEVPSLPSNILLAPASATSAPAPTLVAPSLVTQPVKLDSNLAASIANVPVPPPPSEATSLLTQTSGSDTKTTNQVLPNQTVPSVGGQTVEQVTQHMAGLSVGQPQPVLLPPVSAAQPAQQSVTTPPQQVGGAIPQVPVQGVQSLPSINQSMRPGQAALAASSSAPALAHQSEPVKTVYPVPVMSGGQPVNPATSMPQDPRQQQQHQPGLPAHQQQVRIKKYSLINFVIVVVVLISKFVLQNRS